MNKSLENFSSATASQYLNEENSDDDVPMERALEQVGGRGKFQFGFIALSDPCNNRLIYVQRKF